MAKNGRTAISTLVVEGQKPKPRPGSINSAKPQIERTNLMRRNRSNIGRDPYQWRLDDINAIERRLARGEIVTLPMNVHNFRMIFALRRRYEYWDVRIAVRMQTLRKGDCFKAWMEPV